MEIEALESIAKRKGMKEEDLERIEREVDGMEGEEWLRYVAKVWRMEEWAAKKAPCEVQIAQSVDEGWSDSLPEDVCVTGSLYLCGDFLDRIHYHLRVCCSQESQESVERRAQRAECRELISFHTGKRLAG